MKTLLGTLLLFAQTANPPVKPVYQSPVVDDLKMAYAECTIESRQESKHIEKLEAYIKTLEAENAELKKKSTKGDQ